MNEFQLFNIVTSVICIGVGIGGLIWAYFELKELKRLQQ